MLAVLPGLGWLLNEDIGKRLLPAKEVDRDRGHFLREGLFVLVVHALHELNIISVCIEIDAGTAPFYVYFYRPQKEGKTLYG